LEDGNNDAVFTNIIDFTGWGSEALLQKNFLLQTAVLNYQIRLHAVTDPDRLVLD
jgi:hypothetical protein